MPSENVDKSHALWIKNPTSASSGTGNENQALQG